MSRNIRHRLPLPILACLLTPFVVGFDLPDSAGTYVKVASGRGAHHVSGCHRGYDSEIVEGHIAMRASLDTEGKGTAFWSRVQPRRTTLGVYGNFTSEKLTLLDTTDADPATHVGGKSSDHGLAGGLYTGFDWTWVGLQVGLAGFSVLQQTEDVDNQGGSPALGLRLGRERLYVSAEVFEGGAAVYRGRPGAGRGGRAPGPDAPVGGLGKPAPTRRPWSGSRLRTAWDRRPSSRPGCSAPRSWMGRVSSGNTRSP